MKNNPSPTIQEALDELLQAVHSVSYGSAGVRFVIHNKKLVRIEQDVQKSGLVSEDQ